MTVVGDSAVAAGLGDLVEPSRTVCAYHTDPSAPPHNHRMSVQLPTKPDWSGTGLVSGAGRRMLYEW